MRTANKTLPKRIAEFVNTLPEGTPISAKGLLHLGNRAAVDQALSRLARRNELLRVSWGLYLKSIHTRFGMRPPSVPTVLSHLAERTGETITPQGAAAANALGLTTQVPMRQVYLTSGPTRRLQLGAQTVELRHAPRWQLSLAGRPAGEAIRALNWLGRNHGTPSLAHLAKTLPPASVRELLQIRGRLPNWLAEEVSALATHV
jgi:hypothetical protein